MTKCFSVRLQGLVSISDKCYKAIAFDGSEDLIPKSQVYGQDWDISKSEAYWISAWIMERKKIQYSKKKWTMFAKDGRNVGQVEFKHYVPEKINKEVVHDKELER